MSTSATLTSRADTRQRQYQEVKSRIHETQANRPAELLEGSGFKDSEEKLSRRIVGDNWMEPEQAGELVAEGILRVPQGLTYEFAGSYENQPFTPIVNGAGVRDFIEDHKVLAPADAAFTAAVLDRASLASALQHAGPAFEFEPWLLRSLSLHKVGREQRASSPSAPGMRPRSWRRKP